MASHYEEIYYDRFLPASLKTSLIGLAARMVGAILLLLLAAAWISLITWSSSDPSFTHTTSHQIDNALGAPGAVFADLLLQAFGLASVLVLLSPMFWGLELVTTQQLNSCRTKILFYGIAILLLAGAFSALPSFPAWHFQQGLGGAIGDIAYSLGANAGGLVLPNSGGAVAGFVFFTLGFGAVVHSLGMQVRELFAITQRNVQTRLQKFESTTADAKTISPHLPIPEESSGVTATHVGEAVKSTRPRSAEWGPYDPGFSSSDFHSELLEEEPADTDLAPYDLDDDRGRGVSWDGLDIEGGETDFDGAHLEDIESYRDIEENFDLDTDDASQMMAQRFAPARSTDSKLKSVGRKIEETLSGVSMMTGAKRQHVKSRYKSPSLNLLQRATAARPSAEMSKTTLRKTADILTDVLSDFGVRGEVSDIRPGPVVTVFEFEPARGTKASRVIGLADDIARNMCAKSARAAVVPGRSVIGIELPNAQREHVVLRDVLASEAFRNFNGALPLALGKTISGDPVVADLAAMPHLLVAGTTGSGKSVGINAMIASLVYKHAPDDCRLLMIDPKMLELSVYNGIPHLLCPVVTDPEHAVNALNWVVCEMEERYKRMSKLAVRNIRVFNNRVRNAQKSGQTISRSVQTGFDGRTGEAIFEQEQMDLRPMPYIVVVIDEFADLMIAAGKEVESAVQRLAQMARAAGIHLIMATQRPSVDVITGTIKANFPTRIGFKVASKVDSRTILNEPGAEQLLGQGDMLLSTGSERSRRVHGPFVSDEEIELIAGALRQQGGPGYVKGITDSTSLNDDRLENAGTADGDLYETAVELVQRDQKASVSYLQRRLSIGYNRAADLIERMEQAGIVSSPTRNGRRDVLVQMD